MPQKKASFLCLRIKLTAGTDFSALLLASGGESTCRISTHPEHLHTAQQARSVPEECFESSHQPESQNELHASVSLERRMVCWQESVTWQVMITPLTCWTDIRLTGVQVGDSVAVTVTTGEGGATDV